MFQPPKSLPVLPQHFQERVRRGDLPRHQRALERLPPAHLKPYLQQQTNSFLWIPS